VDLGGALKGLGLEVTTQIQAHGDFILDSKRGKSHLLPDAVSGRVGGRIHNVDVRADSRAIAPLQHNVGARHIKQNKKTTRKLRQ
jgi:hypothetical protein